MEKDLVVASEPGSRILTGHAGPPPGQGPFISIKLIVVGDLIRSATFETYQCPGCQACGRALVELVTGNRVEAARAIRYPEVVAKVGALEKHRQICYGLAVLALANALEAF